MGVNINSDTVVPNLLSWLGTFPFDGDGFTDGDPQVLTPPTQLTARWFNAVQFELNSAIASGGLTPVYTGDDPNTAQWQQLAISISIQDRDYYPRMHAVNQTTYRSHTTLTTENWKEWKKSDVKVGSSNNTTQTFCAIDSIPNEAQFWVEYTAECVQTDSLTTYSNVVLRCSCRKTGGTVTVQKTTTVDSDGALGVTWSVVNDAGKPALRAQLPVAAGKTFNISAVGVAHNVLRA